MTRLRRLGLQRRIMLLVAVGLAAMFTIGGFFGLSAIDEATDLVFNERLATAYSTVAVVERDFERLAADMTLILETPGIQPGNTAHDVAGSLLDVVGAQARYPFFSVVAVELIDREGRAAGGSGATPLHADSVSIDPDSLPSRGTHRIGLPTATAAQGVPFADLAIPVAIAAVPEIGWVVARTISTNSTARFDPAAFTRGGPGPDDPTSASQPSDAYNLEIIDAEGRTALSLGEGGPAGSLTEHFAAIKPMLDTRTAGALVDERADEPHVMAGVPIAGSPLYLVLEQPVDVALALPNQLRERLFVLIGIGFIGALAGAWITTRRVVKPTEELTRAASRIAEGDLTKPIDVAANDEIATLAETLELMRQRLLDAQRQLVDINQDLERRIGVRTARLEFVLRKTISAQESERHALARELHDETAQTLAALAMALDRARQDVATEPDHGLARISEAKAIAARLLSETRRLIMGLRPSVLDDLGLGAALSWYAETIMTERDQAIHVKVDAPSERMPRHLEVALFRIAQEALNNVAKHSGAATASVRIRQDGHEVELLVVDDGIGFDATTTLARTANSGGVGLAGMQERVALLGGTLEIASSRGNGTAIHVRTPITEEDQ